MSQNTSGTLPIQGLSSSDVLPLQKQYGLNTFTETKRQSAFITFLAEFKSPLVIMLIVAAIISFASASYVSGSLIILIIIVSSVIDFSVSYKSQKAAEILAHQIAPKTTVLRDGAEKEIALHDVVPGDIVILEAGNIVPADGIVVEEKDFYVNESALTGESLPIEKTSKAEVYLGSGAVTGRAYVKVTATGQRTKFSHIISLLSTAQRPSEFERGIKDFSVLIARVAIVMALFVFAANALLKHDVLQSLIFALALAVGITPELLPVIIAVNVSRSSLKMAKQGVIVKRLSAIENFGGMNILCTDKTGTLTEDRISVVKYIDIYGKDSDDLLKLGFVTSFFHTGTKTPLDDAIVRFKDFNIDDYDKVDEIPFDFERRRDSIVADEHIKGSEGKRVLISKGAPENMFTVSNLNEAEKKAAEATFESLSSEGYRVLAIATAEVSKTTNDFTPADEKGMVFRGFIAFIDPPKPEVKETLAELERQQIEIKVITGDHRKVAEKIAKEVGLISKGTLEAEEVDALSDLDLAVRAEQTTLFTRVTPVQKNRIIIALQSLGHTVGYMGDGVNDAPALRTADVGVSVDNAVDVAKEAADIILLTKSLKQLSLGVTEGRRTFANTVKYISMAISSNFGNMFSMTGASLLFPFLPMLPTQILLNNLLYEGSQFAVTVDNVDEEVLNQPNPWNIAFLKKFMVVFGIVSSVFDFAMFYVLYKIFGMTDSAFQTGWFIESFASQTLVIFIIRTHRSIFKGVKPHISVVLSSVLAVAVAWVVALSPIGAVFGFVALPTMTTFAILGVVIVYFTAVEITKLIFYKKVGLAGKKLV